LGAADDVVLLKAATTTTTDISGATWAAITNMDGYYAMTVQSGWLDIEGLGTISIRDNSECLPVKISFMVMNDNSYEAFYENASELLAVNIAQVAEDAVADGGDGLLDTNIKEVDGSDVPVTTATFVSDALGITGGASSIQADATGYVKISPGTGTGQTLLSSGTVSLSAATETQIDNIETDTAAFDTAAECKTLIFGWPMVDLAAGAPAYDADAATVLNYIYEAWRNGYKTDGTNSEIVYYKDDGTTPLVEATIADDGTDFTREELRAPD
jgi:hypothetical protein